MKKSKPGRRRKEIPKLPPSACEKLNMVTRDLRPKEFEESFSRYTSAKEACFPRSERKRRIALSELAPLELKVYGDYGSIISVNKKLYGYWFNGKDAGVEIQIAHVENGLCRFAILSHTSKKIEINLVLCSISLVPHYLNSAFILDQYSWWFSEDRTSSQGDPIIGLGEPRINRYSYETEKIPAEGTIYFVECPALSLMKIGFTHGLDARVKGIDASSPCPVRLYAQMGGTVKDERTLHRKFSHLRTHREWFRIDTELLDYILEHAKLQKSDQF